MITLNVDFVKKNPIEEDHTEQKFLIINLEQVLIKTISNVDFIKNLPDQS